MSLLKSTSAQRNSSVVLVKPLSSFSCFSLLDSQRTTKYLQVNFVKCTCYDGSHSHVVLKKTGVPEASVTLSVI